MNLIINEAALAAVKRLKHFIPGKADGKPEALLMTLPARFRTK